MEDLNARMAAMTADQRKAAIEAAQRSQSSKRYQEMERERKRRQLKTQGGQEKTSFFQSTKLALMNSGLIPLKKGKRCSNKALDSLLSSNTAPRNNRQALQGVPSQKYNPLFKSHKRYFLGHLVSGARGILGGVYFRCQGRTSHYSASLPSLLPHHNIITHVYRTKMQFKKCSYLDAVTENGEGRSRKLSSK